MDKEFIKDEGRPSIPLIPLDIRELHYANTDLAATESTSSKRIKIGFPRVRMLSTGL
jgi:hypothetical protein